MTSQKDIYKPNVKNGENLYNKFSSTNGTDLDYSVSVSIPYTWNDFTDLVQYERNNDLSPLYSAMMAINLMKGKLLKKNFYFESNTYDTWETAWLTFLTDNFMVLMKTIPNWNIESGVYFDKYYELWIHDAERATSQQISKIKDSVPFNMSENIENENNPRTDTIENKALNSAHSLQFKNTEDYESAEKRYLESEKRKIADLLFADLNDTENFSISKEQACLTAFLNKFLGGIALSSVEVARQVSDIVIPIYSKD